MAQLRQDYQQIKEKRTEVIVVGPDSPAAFRRYWAENDLPFIGLPDPKHTVLKLYGQQVKIFKGGRMPAQAIIDKNGFVRYIHYGHSMSDIPQTGDILNELNGDAALD